MLGSNCHYANIPTLRLSQTNLLNPKKDMSIFVEAKGTSVPIFYAVLPSF